jgi:hypothetical protein
MGIPFLPVRITQTDDPTYIAALRINAMQGHAFDGADSPNAGLTIFSAVIDTLNDETVKQKSGKFEGQPSLSFVTPALSNIPLKIHPAWSSTHVVICQRRTISGFSFLTPRSAQSQIVRSSLWFQVCSESAAKLLLWL